jgi:phospholipid/cholesterol/gamma-HCH transport system substrate-binding protein
MASKEQVGWAKFRVGILGATALFFLTLLVFLLTGGSDWFTRKVPLRVYVSDAAGLAEGAPVRINGIQAGKVKDVSLSGETNPERVIKVDFAVDSDMLSQIPIDSVASVGSDNLLGSTKFLDITKGKEHQTLQPNATMRSANTAQFDQLVKQGFGVLDSAQAILAKLQELLDNIENGKGTIGKMLVDPSLYNSLQGTISQVQLLSTTLNSRTGSIGQLINNPALYNQAQALLTRIDQITTNLQNGQGTAGQLLTDRKLYDQVNSSVTQLNTLLTNLNSGKGTAGQLLTNDKISNQVSATLDKLNVTIDKMNSGQGTIGQLLVNPQLYEEATGTTRELHATLKDFRANPKKFLTIHLKIF